MVKNTDAHAWTEVYFPSLGWIRFEPTPAGQGTANPPDYMNSGADRAGTARQRSDHRRDQWRGAPQPAAAKRAGPNGKPPRRRGGAAPPGPAAGRAGTPWTAVRWP